MKNDDKIAKFSSLDEKNKIHELWAKCKQNSGWNW